MEPESADWPPPEDEYGQPAALNYAVASAPPATGLAIAALVLGLVSLLGGCICGVFGVPLGILGIVLGIVALTQTNRDPARYGGKGLAIAGICTGGVGLVFPIISIIIMVFAAFGTTSTFMQTQVTQAIGYSQMQSVGATTLQYASQNGGAFPDDLSNVFVGGVATSMPSTANANGPTSVYYVAGLRNDDDPSWILAYGDPADYAGEGAQLLLVDGTLEFVLEPEFTRRLDAFREAYEADRGAEPVIIPPH